MNNDPLEKQLGLIDKVYCGNDNFYDEAYTLNFQIKNTEEHIDKMIKDLEEFYKEIQSEKKRNGQYSDLNLKL